MAIFDQIIIYLLLSTVFESCKYVCLIVQEDIEFARRLREAKGFEIQIMAEDGACLFRAVGKTFNIMRLVHGTYMVHIKSFQIFVFFFQLNKFSEILRCMRRSVGYVSITL